MGAWAKISNYFLGESFTLRMQVFLDFRYVLVSIRNQSHSLATGIENRGQISVFPPVRIRALWAKCNNNVSSEIFVPGQTQTLMYSVKAGRQSDVYSCMRDQSLVGKTARAVKHNKSKATTTPPPSLPPHIIIIINNNNNNTYNYLLDTQRKIPGIV